MTLKQAQPSRTPAAAETDPLLQAFRAFEEASASNPAWLIPLRKEGLARFAERGFPTVQHEDWRFTSLAPLAKLPFRLAEPGASTAVGASSLAGLAFQTLPGSTLVFVDGILRADLSRLTRHADGVVVCSMATALASHGAIVPQALGTRAPRGGESLASLNTAFFRDGAFIHVPEGVAVTDPVRLLFASTSKESGASTHPRVLVVAGARSKLTVVEQYVSLGAGGVFTNPVTELVVGDEADVEHLRLQDEGPETFHIGGVYGEFGRGSRASLHSFALGSRLSRCNFHTRLAGEHLECVLNGLYLTRGEQIADHHMIVEHAQPHCASHEYFNGILDDRSRGVFHGRILVHPAAQKTDAKQTNKNILLSDDATVDAKPQLEIYADDVKCTHGATVGQLNEESIFYLRSRGIGLDRARRMLIHSFAGEITGRIQHAGIREELDRIVWDRLEQQRKVAVDA